MTGARVLITGAGGFVGSHLAVGLTALGYRVTALDRTFDAATRARLSGTDLVERDLSTLGDDDLAVLDTPSVVIHAAALTTAPSALGLSDAEHVTANMLPLLTLLRHAARVRPSVFVFLSSSGVFSNTDGSPDLGDRDAATARGPYSAAKRAGENLVPGALAGVCETFCIRLGHLYGPDEAVRPTRVRVSMLRQWLDTARDGGTIEVDAADPRRDWTFVPDLAPAIARLVAGPGRCRPIHLCAPEAPHDSTLARMILRRYPTASLRTVTGAGVKAPMTPSVLPALDGFDWTGIEAGLDALCREDVAA
ncbi:MAG: NAD-dependent epimerase/dehydratase family protein [Inquilinaceae bacterium]